MRRWWRRKDEDEREEKWERDRRDRYDRYDDRYDRDYRLYDRPERDFWGWDPFEDFFPRSSIFREIEEEMERMHREMDEIMSKVMRGEIPPPEKGGPIVYGFTMRVGPDGKPEIHEFGNTKLAREDMRRFFRPFGMEPQRALPESDEYLVREPITDVFDKGEEVSIIAEMPGVEKDDIDLNITEDSMDITVDTPTRKYRKHLEFDFKVDPKSARATYKNGVLEVKLKKIGESKKPGFKVKVE